MKNNNIIQLFKVLDKWWWQYLVAALLMIVGIFFRLLEPKVFQVAIDELISAKGTAQNLPAEELDFFAKGIQSVIGRFNLESILAILIGMAAVYVLINLGRGVFMLASSALKASSAELSIKKLRDKLFAHIQALPMSYYTKVPTGQVIQRCTGDIDTVKKFILNQVVEVLRLFALFAFSFYMMWIVHPKFTLISVCLVPIIGFGAFFFFKKEGKIWEGHEEEADKLNAIVTENLNGIRTVQSFANEEREIERFDKQNKEKLKWGMKHVWLHAAYWPVSDLIFWSQITLAFVVGGYYMLSMQLTPGQLVSFYTYIITLAWPMRQLGRIVSEMGMASVAIERINSILNSPTEKYDGAKIVQDIIGEIEFKNVSFKYKEDWILKDVSFKINSGENVAFIGPAGAGKSTIIKLLTRFYEPNEGSIYIDGEAISGLSKKDIRERMGYVLQKAFLFSTNIHENIAYTNPNEDRDKVIEASKMAQFDGLKHILSNGYETQVGEKGITLSGGQKQRVSLARTLLDEPDVLILDDVTSAVDTETEHAIFDGMSDFLEERTSIIISHRVTSIQKANRIFVLEGGSISQRGTHDELMAEEGYYKQIHQLQLALEDSIEKDLKQ